MKDLKKRVVVTGMGIISCLGNDINSVSKSLQKGIAGYDIDPERKELGFRCPITGIIKDFDPKDHLDRKRRKTMSLSTIWAYVSAEQAIKDAGLTKEMIANPETGIIFGNDSVAQPTIEMADELRQTKETKMLGSGFIFQIMNSTVTMNLSTIFNTKGANWTIAAACASGSHSVGQAAELIKNGHQERVIAGGSQEINWHSMASFDALGAFSINWDNPKTASKPFDKNRDGLIPSGGSATLILERLDLALKRNANIYGEIAGYAFSSDGEDLSIPNGFGAELAIKKVLKNTDIHPEKIEYINAHATSTPGGDKKEALAIYNIFGNKPFVSSTKSMTGHECWMAGASELIYSFLMIRDGFLAPNINFKEGDEETGKINVINKKIDYKPKIILSNSFGFGGTNAAVIIKKFDE